MLLTVLAYVLIFSVLGFVTVSIVRNLLDFRGFIVLSYSLWYGLISLVCILGCIVWRSMFWVKIEQKITDKLKKLGEDANA